MYAFDEPAELAIAEDPSRVLDERVVDRDVPDDAGVTIRNPAALRRWMTAHAASSSTSAAIEVKLARTVSVDDGRHLTWLKSKLGDQVVDRIILTTGPQAYRREDDIAVVPLALLRP